MKTYEASPGHFIPVGQTLKLMYQGDAMMDQMIEICGVDGLLPQPDSSTWTTKNGTTVAITDMTDAHLRNTIHYLRRLYGTQLDDEIEDLEESDTVPAFPVMLAEAERRGLRL